MKFIFKARYALSLFFILFYLNLLHAQNWDRYAVLLGEKNLNQCVENKPGNNRVVSIRIDAEGNYYPNHFIKDKSLKRAGGKLSSWYNSNPSKFKEVMRCYNLDSSDEALVNLNAKIEAQFIKQIDSLAIDRQIVFLIHGYRKRMYSQKDNTLSSDDYDVVETNMGNDKVFVEVFWDSRHIGMFAGSLGKKGLKIMEASAKPIAKKVGIQLRSLLSGLKKNRIAILSHSLGSVVANQLTFNFDQYSSDMQGKIIRSAYLGPAIGYESFKEFNKRGATNYDLDICVAYNNDDFVLRKEFGHLGKWLRLNALTYGDTSLGCNYEGAVDKLEQLFTSQMPNETVPLEVDMSGKATHHYTYYTLNRAFDQVVAFMFNP